MARLPLLEKLGYADLVELRTEIDALLVGKQAEERAALRNEMIELARAHGFDIDDIVGTSRRKGPVAIKYRDPDNPDNTWTGRGRMPRWMAAATKKRGVRKEDFLI